MRKLITSRKRNRSCFICKKAMCEKCTVNETAFKTVKIVNSNKEIKK